MNDFLQLVNARQSDRAYDKSRLVEADKLERILEAGRLAPSACNAPALEVRGSDRSVIGGEGR